MMSLGRGSIMKLLIVCTLFNLASTAVAATQSTDVIYGEDNRKDLYETTNPMFLKLARSTAGRVSLRRLSKSSDTTFAINFNRTLEEDANI